MTNDCDSIKKNLIFCLMTNLKILINVRISLFSLLSSLLLINVTKCFFDFANDVKKNTICFSLFD